MFWLLVAVAAVAGAAYYNWSRRRLYQLAKEIPSLPNSYPIIGHSYMFLGNSEARMETLQYVGDVANQQGGLLCTWLTNKLFITMTDPSAIEVVTKSCLDKDEFTIKFTRTAIGNGSIFAPVNIWHPRRKINTPFFNLKNLNQVVPTFHDKSSIMVELMQAEVSAGDFPIWKYFTTYTFDSIFETVTDMKMNSQKDKDHFVLNAIEQVTHMVGKRILQPWLHPNFVYHNLPVYERFQEHLQRSINFADEVIQATKKRLAAADISNTNSKQGLVSSNLEIENTAANSCMTFLESIIQSSGGLEKGYSDIELREEVMVMIVAGNDTSAVGASFTAVLLSRHPDVQEKVYQELQEVFGDSSYPVTSGDLPRLKYLEAVIKESLRLYPPVPVVVREVHQDTILPSGTTLVDGTSVLINIWGTHRNPSYWGEDADVFRPERFLEGPLRHPAQFIPFSYSVRSCIGSTYAMLSAKTALANLLRRYRLLPPTGACAAGLALPLPVKFEIMMKAVDDFIVRVEERKQM